MIKMVWDTIYPKWHVILNKGNKHTHIETPTLLCLGKAKGNTVDKCYLKQKSIILAT